MSEKPKLNKSMYIIVVVVVTLGVYFYRTSQFESRMQAPATTENQQ
ncbi:MAG: hypothetical protein V4598_18135 [Bdellovibrionota bacterium]